MCVFCFICLELQFTTELKVWRKGNAGGGMVVVVVLGCCRQGNDTGDLGRLGHLRWSHGLDAITVQHIHHIQYIQCYSTIYSCRASRDTHSHETSPDE